MNNKVLGKKSMDRAEKAGTIEREQFGGRHGQSSIIAALNKRLTMDLIRLKRTAAALLSNDAKSCFDRMVHNMTCLAFRRQGVDENTLRSLFLTLQKSVHRVRTAFGVSEASYWGDEDDPVNGIGQGNGAGPTGWVFQSTPIISMMKAEGFGFADTLAKLRLYRRL